MDKATLITNSEQSQLNPNLNGFTGGISVNKYPFDLSQPDRKD